MLKLYFKSFIYLFTSIIVLTLFVTLLEYFGILPNSIIKYIKLIIPIISIFIGSFIMSKNSNNMGYKKGIIIGIIYIILTILFAYLIFGLNFEYRILIFFIITLISSILGGMFGIAIKSTPNN